MERKVFGRGVAALCLALILGFGCLSVGATASVAYAGTTSRAAYTADEFEITQDGVTYSCETTDKGTAEITGIVADDSVTAVNVPGSIEHGGQTYRVTELKFSSGIVAENVEQLTLPDTLENVYGWYFRKFAKVKELHIPGSIKDFSCTLQNSRSLEKLYFDEGVEEISANMMVNGCSSLSEINLPSTLKTISGSGAFEGATALKSIEFPKDVVFADNITGVLEGCTSLTSVSLPASVTKIPSHMFDGCASLTSVTALSEIESIGDGAFQNCSSLTGIDFPGTLTSIGSSAFQGCSSLVSVPDLSKVTKMGSAAFRECGNLRASVDLSSLQSVPGYAFCYTPVKIVGLCDSLKSIGDWAFIWSNVAVQLPETLEKIGNYTFFGGTLPKQLSIPDSVTSVGKAAFSSVDGVRDVTIGRGLTKIPAGMFDDSTVQKITIENSVDDITGSDNLPSSGVDIVYTRESIDDVVGDTVSDGSTETLQDLVYAAPDGKETVIKLEKHVKLGSTLRIPARKMIKITSDGPHTILAKKSGVSELVNVAEGASLELSGKVSLRGRYNKGAIISSKGAVVLSGEAVVYDGTASNVNTGVVDVSGDKASLTMTGGVIEQCELKDVYCGTVHAKDGAHVVMKGGVIRKNHVASSTDGDGNYLSSTGVMLMGNASFDMSDGSIEDNAGYQGGAVVMYSEARNQRASFEMTGGQLVRNKGYKLGNRTPSGAVHVEGNAEFTLKDGKIEDNIAYSDGKGGGVCVVDLGLQQGGKDHTAFTMKGGSVSGNSASAGGGIYTYSDDVTLSAGEIKGNTAWNMGGGVYSEGNEYLVYSTLHIENALVVDNHADKQGGGMWFCPTGDAKVYVQDGGLIAKNTAGEAGDDFVFTGAKDAKYKLTLANRAPGGGKVSWYKDGGLFNPEGTYAATNPDVPRFTPDGDNGEPLSFTDATPNVALKSVMSEDVYNLGRRQTSLMISGNTAKRGGGIGANGGVVIGKSENIKIPIKKVWENPRIPHPNKVKVNLKNGDTVIDSITLSESNDWKGVFSNLPQRDASGAVIKYTVAEDAVEGYGSKVSGDAERGFTVTNASTAKVSVPVEKRWVGPAAAKATVRLLADGKDTGKKIDLDESNNWKGSFDGLAKYSKSGSVIAYTVAEDAVEGYSSKVSGDAERGFTVTNASAAKVSVPVEKRWVGPAAAKATVRLLADGKDTGKKIDLDESNNWKGSFDGLAKYSKSGSVIAYTVAEDAVEGYSSKVSGDAERGFTVTNAVKTGGLDVSKTVVAREGLAVDADKIFKFVVEATDATGRKVSGIYGDATFEDGKATLKLKDGQTVKIAGLPAGTTYTVTERAAGGYKTAVNDVEGSKAEGVIAADQVSAAAFTNTFDPAPAKVSVPELAKVLAGGRKPGLQEGEFTFELSLTDDADNVLEGYPIEAKNGKDGKVSFGELSFTNPGTYHAAVTERANGDVLVEDDAHAYTFDITVTQTGAGLKAEVSNERGKKTFTNTFTPHDNTKAVTKADASGAKVDVNGKPVSVGDTLTYTINWANNGVDDRGAARAADVTVTDALPKGVNYVEGSADGAAYDAATRTLTWSLGEQAAGATGTLSFDVKVSADAATVDDIANTATVKVGENESQTNTTHNSVSREGSLTVKKTVVGGDSHREFGFTVELADGDGEPVSGTFGKGEHAVTFTDGRATFTLKHGGEKTITGLPVGASYTVTEDAAEGYTTTAEGAEGTVTEDGATVAFTNTYGTATEGRDVSTTGLFTKTLKGRDWAEGDSFQFTLTGEDGAPMPEGAADGSKTVGVTAAAGTKAGDRVAFDFGAIRYTLDDIKGAGFAEVDGKRVRAKTFTYTVHEVRPDDGATIAGVAYDGHAAMMTVTVTDDGSGNLTASTPAIAQASGGDFVNTYTTELDYSARAGVRLSKTLSGRAMEAGQFAFTVTADDETAAKLGLKTDKNAYTVAAADDGEASVVNLVGGAAGSDVEFTDADAGKTYSFTVTETKLGGEGYTNDTAPRTVTIAPAYDAATGELTVTTTVARDGVEVARSEVSTADSSTALPAPVTVAFQNSYEATGTLGGEGDVAISATKTLTGRAAAAGEFSFSVRDAHGSEVATASNRASGDGEAAELTFSPISYTTGSLEQMVGNGTVTRVADGSWTIPYIVSEDTAALPAGVTAAASSFGITVKVTDNGKGGLDTAVVYPEGSDGKLSFVNGYGTNEATVDLAGTKTLALSQAGLGLTQADIAGKYTFKIEPLDGAPAPVDASGKTVTEAVNDAAGNVELGSVTFRQPSDLDDAAIDGDGLRSKTFAYRVSESGSVDGVANDAVATKVFTVKVVENANAGTLATEVLPAEGTPEGKGAFEFTNTYGVDPTPSSVTDQIKVNKKLKGRDLAEGEFEFQLVEINADGSESVATTGKNAADGTVALDPVTYTAPGTHSYELREVTGTAGGVTYDKATYRVRTTVTDAGNGTLAVKHELADAEGNPTGDDSVTFANGYGAAPVTLKLGAAKVLKGTELKAGQFGFELKGRDGKVMSTARNAADGSVTFDALTFKRAGTYTFTVSEVDDGQAHVTYDRAVHKIVVTVSDEAADGTKTGYLSAKVSYEGDANLPPVFTNSYAEEPGTPENPGTPGGGSDSGSGGGSKGGMPDTGDRSLPVEALAAMAGIGALAVAGGAALYRRRR